MVNRLRVVFTDRHSLHEDSGKIARTLPFGKNRDAPVDSSVAHYFRSAWRIIFAKTGS
jgi:hypothetical protein